MKGKAKAPLLLRRSVFPIKSEVHHSPQIESRDPQTVLSFVTDVLDEVGVTFNEAAKNVLPGDLVANESPATGEEGIGLRPFTSLIELDGSRPKIYS